MLSLVKKRISLKIAVTLVTLLLIILSLFSWFLIEERRQVLEEQYFAKVRTAVLVGAETFSRLLDEWVLNNRFSLEEIFDEDYQLIVEGPLSGAEIPRYHTRYDRYLDESIQHVEDAFLSDEMVAFAVLVDRNGYLPTHNSRYSKPLSDNPDKDRIGNRTKRIFNDPVGLAAARFTGREGDAVLRQTYHRDTGAVMWDVSAPVVVQGKHWGAFRIGLSMEQTDVQVQTLKNTVLIATALVLLSCSLLIPFFVSGLTRPLKLLTQAVQAISSGARREKIELVSNDEVGVLVTAFNEMNDALEGTTVSRDSYDRLVRSMHDLLIVSDPVGKIVSVNRATCEILGFNENYLLNHSVQDLVKLRVEDDDDWFARQVADRQNYTADVSLINCEEEWVPMAMSCSPLTDEHELSGFILLFQDNSERIRAEQAKDLAFDQAFIWNKELQEINERMEEKNSELEEAYVQLKNSQLQILQQEKMASIGQLAAGVAHEINNPMGFITSNLTSLDRYFEKLSSYLEQLEAGLGQVENQARRDELKALKKKLKIAYLLEDIPELLSESSDGAARVRDIVQNLKSFSRIDQDGFNEVDVNDCLESTIKIAWNEIKYKATLERDFAPLPPLACYPQQLNQVFLNMLVNAAQAIEKQGVIRVRTRVENEKIQVAISDNGCGIPQESLSRIFEPFFTTKEAGKGTGLGMSISYDIIKKHRGEIQVASRVGQGTTFTISLPLGREEDSHG
ncbi:MAG: PAS domain S-box protein [Desulfuromonadales bacterium]|nr:PAS domain S-box protein [Desulfuromonadales bacterium]